MLEKKNGWMARMSESRYCPPYFHNQDSLDQDRLEERKMIYCNGEGGGEEGAKK